MSIEIQSSLTRNELSELIIQIGGGTLQTKISTIHPYIMDRNVSRIPFRYALSKGYKTPVFLSDVHYTFHGTLRKEQIEVVKQSFSFLAKTQTLLLSTHVGFGKTIIALYIISQLRMKTCIVIGNRNEIKLQWERALKEWIPAARVCVLSSKEEMNTAAFDIFIINAVSIPKVSRGLHKIGLVIVDEVHLVLSPVMCVHLLYFTPQYLVGLTATPYRPDDSNRLFDLYFGQSIIYKALHKPHTVYKVITPFIFKVKKNKQGRIEWNDLLKQQAESFDRNKLIVSIVKTHKTHKYLILCKRIIQVCMLQDLFLKEGITVEAVYGSKKVDNSAQKQVLIGITSKLGVGFDDPSINALILAADVQEYFIQYLGRVFRNPSTQPIIFDIVDVKTPVLARHFAKREEIYRKAGVEFLLFKFIK